MNYQVHFFERGKPSRSFGFDALSDVWEKIDSDFQSYLATSEPKGGSYEDAQGNKHSVRFDSIERIQGRLAQK